MEKNTINYILVLPYSPVTCRYYLNNSNDSHATTYEKVITMLSKLAPWGIYQIDHNMSRKLPFYVDIKERTIQVVEPDEVQMIEEARKEHIELNQSGINKFLESQTKAVDNRPRNSVYWNMLQSKLWRKEK